MTHLPAAQQDLMTHLFVAQLRTVLAAVLHAVA